MIVMPNRNALARWQDFAGVRTIACGLVAAVMSMVMCGMAMGQIIPERTYYGVQRAIPVRLMVGEAEGIQAEIELLEPLTGRIVERAAVTPEQAKQVVDLASLFPMIWKDSEPRLLYAQLKVEGKGVGSALVLQPLLSPVYAPRNDKSGAPMFPPEKDRAKISSGIRAYVDKVVVIETSKGSITIGLRPDVAPNTCWNFRQLVEGGLYTDVVFHRIASLAGRQTADIVQTGDPAGTGQGGPGYYLDLEPSKLPHDFGVVSAARLSDPNSGGSQFFIVLNREGTAYLDGRHAAFGVVLDVGNGAEVVRSIAATPVGPDNRPMEPPVIKGAKLVDAAPYGMGPGVAKDPLKRDKAR